ncbi:MAG: class I SAM-dependent methyltransferase [Bacteroidota bacterium]
MKIYDQQHIRQFYDDYAEQETLRWNKSIVEQVKYHVHLHYLDRYIQTDEVVLELGAGTGMFTRELAKRSANNTITDLSPVQLSLNQQRATTEAYEDRIRAWAHADICDLSAFDENQFDKVLCYGGPLSYVFEQKRVALRQIKRVLKPGGIALFSVMNLWGTVHEYLMKGIMPYSVEDNEKVIQSGNLHPSSFTASDHHCHMFTSDEIKKDVAEVGFKLLDLSASNCLSANRADDLEQIRKDAEKWDYFLSLELRACCSPGMIESGTHIIFVVQKSE